MHMLHPRRSGTRRRRAATLAMLAGCLASGVHADGFVTTGSLTVPRESHSATLLSDGRVLIVGETSAELYDPASGQFSPTAGQPLLASGRLGHAAVRLNDGRVLIVGGGVIFAGTVWPDFPRAHAEIYDPATDAFTETGMLIHERYGFEPVLLDDGRVLIAGGQGCCIGVPLDDGTFTYTDTALSSAEIYDPQAGTFGPAYAEGAPFPSVLSAPRAQVGTTRLEDGRILFAGGFARAGSPLPDGGYALIDIKLATADLYDPATGAFSSVPTPMAFARSGAITIGLPGGQALISGGAADLAGVFLPGAIAERFDAASGTFQAAAPPPFSPGFGGAGVNRAIQGRAVPLAGGDVLLAGGLIFGTFGGDPAADLRADVYRSASDRYDVAGEPMHVARINHSATPLADGRVLYAGGMNLIDGTLASAELYDPNRVVDAVFADGFDAAARTPDRPFDAPLRTQADLIVGDNGLLIRASCPDARALAERVGAFEGGRHVFIDPASGRICHTLALGRR